MRRFLITVLLSIVSSQFYAQNFWTALTNNDFKAVQDYIDNQGFDVKNQPVMGFYFANYGEFDKNLMTYMLSKGADINREYKGSAPLVYLLSRDNGEMEWCMEILLTNGVDINPKALKKAYTSCHIDVVKLLLSQKITLSESDVRDLMKTAYQKDNLALGGMLIDMSTHQKILDETFLWSVQDGRLGWVQLLHAKGADIEQEVPITIPALSGKKKTLGVVELAKNFGHNDIVEYLVSIGAGLEPVQALAILTKAYKEDKLYAADNILNRKSLNEVKSKVLLMAVKDENIPWVTSLIFKGAEVNIELPGEKSIFFNAVKTGNDDLLSVLKSFGASLHKGEAGELIQAVYEMDNLRFLETLIANGISIEEMNDLLMRVVRENRKDWMAALISKGADIHTKDSNGVTIFIHALNSGADDIVRELLLRDELHEPSFEIFKQQYPKYELLWAAIINDVKWIQKYGKNKKLIEIKGPHNRTALELYLALYGGTKLHWYALVEDTRTLKSLLPEMKDKIYEVNKDGVKAIDLAESDKVKDLFKEYMY